MIGRKMLGVARLAAVSLGLWAGVALAVSTTIYDLTPIGWKNATTLVTGTGWLDLGAGPLRVQIVGGSAVLQQADATPPTTGPGSDGFVYSVGDDKQFDTSSHVYARVFNLSARVVVTPTGSAAGGGSNAPLPPGTNHVGSVNQDQINGVAVSTGAGPIDSGTQRFTDPNSASYTSAGTAVASGTLPSPAAMPSGGAPRGFGYACDGTTSANSKTTVTLSGGGTTTVSVSPNFASREGISATAATAVTGCTFQSLY